MAKPTLSVNQASAAAAWTPFGGWLMKCWRKPQHGGLGHDVDYEDGYHAQLGESRITLAL